jgi:hypothetical protein
VFSACDRDKGGTVGADEFQKLQHELGEHRASRGGSPAAAGAEDGAGQLVRSFSATDRD